MRCRRYETLTFEKATAVNVTVAAGLCRWLWLWLCRLWRCLWPVAVPVAVPVVTPFAKLKLSPVRVKHKFLQKRIKNNRKTNIFRR